MTRPIPISVVIPVRNEEANLGECLSRLNEFSEVLVVDSGSTDKTCQIASDFGAHVIQFSWDGHYPKKRNWVLLNQPLRNAWVLFLDADELVTREFCDEVRRAVDDSHCAGFWLSYTNHFLGRPLMHGDPQRKLALFKVGSGLYEKIDEDTWSTLDMEVHEHPLVEGEVGKIAAPIDHRDDRGLAKFIERHKDYALWEARRTLQLRNSGPEIWARLTKRQRQKYRHIDAWWFAPAYFVSCYVAKLGFLDGAVGLYYAFYKLWYFMTVMLLLKQQKEIAP